MAAILRRTVGGKPRYDVKYREPDGRQRKKTFLKRVDADRFAATVEADKLRGQWIDPDAGRMAFQRYAEDWVAHQDFAETTRDTVQRRLRVHVYPTLGPKTLAQVRPTTIKSWLAGLDLAESTKKVLYAHVSAILAAAVDDERIASNPARKRSVPRPTIERRFVVPWTVERVAAVRDALPERYRLALELGAGLGLRQGEILGLSPADVDFKAQVVHVRRQVQVIDGHRLIFKLPKGEKERDVPLPKTLARKIAAHMLAFPAQEVTLPWDGVDGKPRTVALVLSTPRGVLTKKTFNPTWHRALVAAGVPTERENGMHALRHHYASVLLDAGETIKAVSEYLGHHDPGFTLRTYTHLMPTSADRTRQAVDAAFARYISGASQPVEGTENAV